VTKSHEIISIMIPNILLVYIHSTIEQLASHQALWRKVCLGSCSALCLPFLLASFQALSNSRPFSRSSSSSALVSSTFGMRKSVTKNATTASAEPNRNIALKALVKEAKTTRCIQASAKSLFDRIVRINFFGLFKTFCICI
jgi:hypothetical protein